jgi:hypothetical protein
MPAKKIHHFYEMREMFKLLGLLFYRAGRSVNSSPLAGLCGTAPVVSIQAIANKSVLLCLGPLRSYVIHTNRPVLWP